MTTISIHNADELSRLNFKDLADLQEYLLIQQLEKEVSEEYKLEIDQRETDLLSGKIKEISWNIVKKEAFRKR